MDELYMRRALELAEKGIGKVNPNPLVGAVIVKGSKIIGEGYHERYGEAHAERNAVKNAAEDVAGSTIYVTLEPCAHYGKTPPCVDLIIEKGFKKVVIGMTDPNPLVAGKSIDKLRMNNIEVITGVLEDDCRKMNEVFIKYITSKNPFVILKAGISLDGKIATCTGQSKWITSSKARMHAHSLRNEMSGIMVGVDTVIKDNPELTYRGSGDGRNPVRIVVDSSLRVPIDSEIIRNNNGNTIAACVKGSNEAKKELLIKAGVRIIETESKDGRVDLRQLMIKLGQENIDSILIEGGGTLNFSALNEGIVDKVRFYIAPKIIGGEKSRSSIGGDGFQTLDGCVTLENMSYRILGNELIAEGYISKERQKCLQEL